MRKMCIIALICLCQALAAESGSVIKSKTKSPNVAEDETTTVISLTEDEMTAVSLTEDETTTATSLISRGTEAKDGEFPWVVFLHNYEGFICSAIILSETTVLTAAHCVSNTTLEYIGYTGTVNRNIQAIRIEFERILIHPGYEIGKPENGNDIAVLKTKEVINFNENVNKICIAGVNTNPIWFHKLIVMGWSHLGDTLRFKEVELLGNHQCSPERPLPVSFICARAINGVTCYGESGGPLVHYTITEEAVLVGVTSYMHNISFPEKNMPNIACGTPARFARVSHYNSFIAKAAGDDHGICISSN